MILSTRDIEEIVNITLNGKNISRVTSLKFLEVMFDKILKLYVHINKVCTKVSLSIGVIRRVSNMVPEIVLYIFMHNIYTLCLGIYLSYYPEGLKTLGEAKQYQCIVFLHTDLTALFFNMTNFINISFLYTVKSYIRW